MARQSVQSTLGRCGGLIVGEVATRAQFPDCFLATRDCIREWIGGSQICRCQNDAGGYLGAKGAAAPGMGLSCRSGFKTLLGLPAEPPETARHQLLTGTLALHPL